MVMGDQRPGDRGARFAVPDGGDHGKDTPDNGDGDSLGCAPPVGFEVELALAVPDGLIIAGRPQLGDVAGGRACLGFAADEALLCGEAGPSGGEHRLDVERSCRHSTFTDLRVGQRPQDRNPSRGAGPPVHLRAPGRRPGASAVHRRRVGDPDLVEQGVTVAGQVPDHLPDQRQHRAESISIPLCPDMGDIVSMLAGGRSVVVTYHMGTMRKEKSRLNLVIWVYEHILLKPMLLRVKMMRGSSDYVRDEFLINFRYKTHTTLLAYTRSSFILLRWP